MASKQFITPVGTDLRSIGSYFQIAGISVDNPSGSWLRVSGIEQFVPPYTLGWTFPVTPTMLNLDVLFVDSPSGTPSELVGDPVTVYLLDHTIGQSSGFASGAAQAQSPVGANIRLATLTLAIANEVGTTTTIATPAAGNRIVPLSFTAAALANGAPTPEMFHTPISVRVVSGAGATLLPLMAISPESPESTHAFPAGTKLAIADVVRVRGQMFAGGGRWEFGASLLYYEQIG